MSDRYIKHPTIKCAIGAFIQAAIYLLAAIILAMGVTFVMTESL